MSSERWETTKNLKDIEKKLLIQLPLKPISPKNGNITYEAATTDGNSWQLQLTQHSPSTPTQTALKLNYNLMFELFSRLEVKNISCHSTPEYNHTISVLFLAANWHILNPLFRPVTQNITMPRCFVEVDLGGSGRADLIGIQSDGTIFVIEVGRRGKSRQVARYVGALQRMLRRDLNIKALVAHYHIRDSRRILQLAPPEH